MSSSALALVPRTQAWHDDRRESIGASDAPLIAGVTPPSWGDPVELLQKLYAEKVGLIDNDEPPTLPMRFGLLLEDPIAAWYTEETGRRLQKVNSRHRHPKYEWMRCSLDRVTVGVRPKRIVQLKTRRNDNGWGEPGTAEVPDDVLIQEQHEMAVAGYDVADVAVLFAGSDPRIYTVERDDDLIAGLIELESEFMACVREGRPPDYSGLVDKGKRVRPAVDGEITAGPALDRLIASTFAATETRKAAEEAELGLKTKLTELIDPFAVVHGSAVDVIYRPNRPSTKVGWEYIAKAYRKAIEHELTLLERDDIATTGLPETIRTRADLDAIESTFTVEQAGARPIRFSERKEES